MGITTVISTVREHRKAEKTAEVELLVDNGAVYSLVPKILDRLGIEPYKEMSFALADGTSIKRRISSYFEFEGEGGLAPVVYGEEGDAAGRNDVRVNRISTKSFYKNITSYEDVNRINK
jgi:hypothetical protein